MVDHPLEPARTPDVYEQALSEGTPALARLANAALLGAEADERLRLPGLTAAALFSRMAAERDDKVPAEGRGHIVHGEVMLMREKYDREHGREQQAAIAGACAIRAFSRAADVGNEAAANRLSEITPKLLPGAVQIAKSWETPVGAAEQAGYDKVLRDAARGDADALITIMHEVDADHQAGVLSLDEAFTIAEQCGRLGMAARHCHIAVRLSRLLTAWAQVERTAGRSEVAAFKEAEALHIMSVTARSGQPGADELLVAMLADAPIASTALAARYDASILSALSTQGAA